MGRLGFLRLWFFALCVLMLPAWAYAQAEIAGVVRDTSGAVLPGVTVEVSSPQLIEKVRVTASDGNGRYQISGLPVGRYKISFKLEKFSTVERSDIELSSDFTAAINADLKIGAATEIVTVEGAATVVDVQNARQRQVFSREELTELPITRTFRTSTAAPNAQKVLAPPPGVMRRAPTPVCLGRSGAVDRGSPHRAVFYESRRS